MRFAQQLRLFLGVSFSAISISGASNAAGQETLVGIVGRDFILLGADSSVNQGVAVTVSNRDKIAPLVDPQPTMEDTKFHTQTRQQQQQQQQQQCIVAAAAGDAALSDRLIGLLQAQATIREYEAGVGCDVRFVSATKDKENDDDDDDVAAVVEAGMTVQGMAHFARSQLSSIRPNANVCLLIAGMMYGVKNRPEASGERPVVFLSHRVQQQVQQAWKPVQPADDVEAPPLDENIKEEEESSSSSSSSSSLSSSLLSPPSLHPHLYWLDELGSLQQIQYGAHGLGSNFCLSVLDQGFRADMTLDEATKLMRDCFHQLRTRYLINSPRPPCIKVVDASGIRLIP